MTSKNYPPVKNQGSRNFKAKLIESEVLDIITSDLSHREIAEKYVVTQSLVRRIRNGKLWKHVFQLVDKLLAEEGL